MESFFALLFTASLLALLITLILQSFKRSQYRRAALRWSLVGIVVGLGGLLLVTHPKRVEKQASPQTPETQGGLPELEKWPSRSLPLGRSRAEIVSAFEEAGIALKLDAFSEYPKTWSPWVGGLVGRWRFLPLKFPISVILSRLDAMGVQSIREEPFEDSHGKEAHVYKLRLRDSRAPLGTLIFQWYEESIYYQALQPGESGGPQETARIEEHKETAITMLPRLFRAIEPGDVQLEDVFTYIREHRSLPKGTLPNSGWFSLGDYELFVGFGLGPSLGGIEIARVPPVVLPPPNAYPIPPNEPQPSYYLDSSKDATTFGLDLDEAKGYKYLPAWSYHLMGGTEGDLSLYGPPERLARASLGIKSPDNEGYRIAALFALACDPNLPEERFIRSLDKYRRDGRATSVTLSWMTHRIELLNTHTGFSITIQRFRYK